MCMCANVLSVQFLYEKGVFWWLIALSESRLWIHYGEQLFSYESGEIELILDAREIKASGLIAHQKVNYYGGHTEPVTLYPPLLSNLI